MHSFSFYSMKKPRISDIIGIINRKFPFSLAQDWDNTGFQLGDATAFVNRIMVALDPLPEVVELAINTNCQLLVTHHPLIFSPLHQITTASTTGKTILKAASNNLSLLSMHTNYDIANNGINDLLAGIIGLQTLKPLKTTSSDNLLKFTVFVPAPNLADVRNALFEYTVNLGNYSSCSFTASGTGTFKPLDGATPAIGSIGNLETVAEERLEILIPRENLTKVIRKLQLVHPYEEPAYDIYPVLNEAAPLGLGRIGHLEKPVCLADFATDIAHKLRTKTARFVGKPEQQIRKIAICSGSGASLLKDAIRQGADLLLTGDVKYHEARDAEAAGIALLDCGHFATEQPMVLAVTDFLEKACAKAGFTVQVTAANCEADPFTGIPAT